jgi:hypothetical protein
MKTILLFWLGIMSGIITAQQSYISDKLTKKWQTQPDFKTPESVCFDQLRNIFYVSNVAGGPSDKDNNGFISTLSYDGKILQLEWCKGLNAPKGMGISGNYLYVTDIDAIVKIDITQRKIVKRYVIKGARFLNDVTVDKDGCVYFSDMNDNAIYRMRGSAPELFIKSEKLNQPNGLYAEGNNLLAGLRDRIIIVNLKSKEITDFILNTGGIDGIVADGKGNYIVSDWLGNVHLVGPRNIKEKLLDTTPEKINAADIEFIPSQGILLIPTFGDNRVMAYQLNPD